MSDLAIDLKDVQKQYGRRVLALRGVDMQVHRGQVFGLLGPNGAGKSTLIKIMMTVVRPTRAIGSVLGRPVGDKHSLSRIGYLPENHRFPRYLTGRQTLHFFSALCGMRRVERQKRASELLDLVGMSEWADRRVGTYSKGMMQRVGLAQAMMHNPDLILLDEPTDGVDPIGRRDIRDVLLRLREQGATIFINSHLLSELELICDRVAILLEGKVVRQGSVDELALKGQRYEIEVVEDAQELRRVLETKLELQLATNSANALVGDWNGTKMELLASTLKLATIDPNVVQPVLRAVVDSGLSLRRFQAVRPSLEELFMEAIYDKMGTERVLPGARLEKRS
jgi:ABC-2 type transport system ATP-binding protein